MALLWLSLCMSAPCCAQGRSAHPHGGGHRDRLQLEPGRQLCSLASPTGRGQWAHSPGSCPTAPPAPSLAHVPTPEPCSCSHLVPQPPGSLALDRGNVHGGLRCTGLWVPWPYVSNTPRHPPAAPLPASLDVQSHGLGTAPHTPLNPARLQAGGALPKAALSAPHPPAQCPRQRHSRARRGTPSSGSTAQPQEEAEGLSPQQREATRSHLGDRHHIKHGRKSPE